MGEILKILFRLILLLLQFIFNQNDIFLIAYAILRSIPNKLGGVVALAMSIIILIICPFMYKRKFRGYIFYPLNKFLFWLHITIWVLLTWLGARPVEDPYIFLGQVLSVIYFVYYFLRFEFQKI